MKTLLQNVINVFAFGPQWWPDQKERLEKIKSEATPDAITEAYAQLSSRPDLSPYNLAKETHVYGFDHPNKPVETDSQRAADVIRGWYRELNPKLP